mgnify:CR=1 FL=1
MHSGLPHRNWRPVVDIQPGVWAAACAVLAALLINRHRAYFAMLDAFLQSHHHPDIFDVSAYPRSVYANLGKRTQYMR